MNKHSPIIIKKTYEYGALFKYTDLHKKLIELFTILPSERLGQGARYYNYESKKEEKKSKHNIDTTKMNNFFKITHKPLFYKLIHSRNNNTKILGNKFSTIGKITSIKLIKIENNNKQNQTENIPNVNNRVMSSNISNSLSPRFANHKNLSHLNNGYCDIFQNDYSTLHHMNNKYMVNKNLKMSIINMNFNNQGIKFPKDEGYFGLNNASHKNKFISYDKCNSNFINNRVNINSLSSIANDIEKERKLYNNNYKKKKFKSRFNHTLLLTNPEKFDKLIMNTEPLQNYYKKIK